LATAERTKKKIIDKKYTAKTQMPKGNEADRYRETAVMNSLCSG